MFTEYARLWRLFRRVALAGVPAVSLGLWACDCGSNDEVHLLRADDPATQALVERCRRPDAPDCVPLCESLTKQPAYRILHCELHEERGGYVQVHVGYESYCPGGRRPEGAAFATTDAASSPTGALFARMAALEAASVPAFRRLAAELARFGAPPDLAAAAQACAGDEVRHARAVAALAARYGARIGRATRAPARDRELEPFAVENGVEGCVRETWGAVLAVHQAAAATDPVVRSTLSAIAADETRHAALARVVQSWVRPRLERGARRRLAEARAEAVADLRRELADDLPAATRRRAGLPDGAVARALLTRLEETIWC